MRCLVMLLLALPVAAGSTAVVETSRQLERAFKSGKFIELRTALRRAEALRQYNSDKDFEPVVRAVGAGVRCSDRRIAIACIETLAKLRQRGSSRFLAALMAPPASLRQERLGLRVAAIRAAGSILDKASIPYLCKALNHGWTEIAVEAATALGRYRLMDDKPRIALVRRLLPTLRSLEKKEAETKKETARAHAKKVRDALVQSLRRLTGARKLQSSADGYAWLKKPLGL